MKKRYKAICKKNGEQLLIKEGMRQDKREMDKDLGLQQTEEYSVVT